MADPVVGFDPGTDLTYQHLESELNKIDLLIWREVRRWRRAGQDPTDPYRGLHTGEDEVEALLERPFGTSWGQTVALDSVAEEAFTEAFDNATLRAERIVEAGRRENRVSRLQQLALTFGLDRFQLDTFLICLAPTLDLRYERLYGFLQDDVTCKRPRLNLVLDLLCGPGHDRLLGLSRLTPEAPLFKYQILHRSPDHATAGQSPLTDVLSVDDTILSWLLGWYQPPAVFRDHVRLHLSQEDPADRLIAGEVEPVLERLASERPIVVFYGPDHAAQEAAARLLVARLGRPLLTVNLPGVLAQEISALHAIRLALRDARLTGAIPCLFGWDACLEQGSPSPNILAELCAYPDIAIVAGRVRWHLQEIDRDRSLRWLEFPVPSYSKRRQLWSHYLARNGLDSRLSPDQLAGQFQLTTSQIRDAVASARDRAAQRGTDPGMEDLFVAARLHSAPRLADLASKVVPRYSWDDIILPADQRAMLREIIATVRGRPIVLEEWGVGRKLAASAGVTILFAGPPGTGKTMAAQVIAGELGLDLYKIDLSTVVSKYIGETEKNLGRIFDEAATSNAILFFDEADAIFGKRGEVKDSHDRYANIEVSYLLQRMESYDGVTILATNLRANMDEAFTRRLHFAIDFPFPDEGDRLRIWQTLFPPGVPRADDLDLDYLARRFKLAGGSIRNIIVSAAYLAAADGGVVTMDHLLHGTRRELQKMGRLIGEVDLVRR